jgi:hypothetical protein
MTMKTFLITLFGICALGVSAMAGGSGAKAGADGKSTADDSGIDAPRLWAQACQRCHNLRPATSFSDAQLQVIVHHMRVRANLTGPEARAIAAFLKEAN